MKKISLILIVLAGALFTIGCQPVNPTVGEQKSSTGARQTNPGKIELNKEGHSTEQANILRRIAATTDPTRLMWIHLMSADGKIVSRMVVQGKVTSSSKRLQPKSVAAGMAGGDYKRDYGIEYNGQRTTEAIQPDGTYGDSDEYIFWFDPQGRYHQLSTSAAGVSYLLTDYPIVLNSGTDVVTGMYELDKAAAEWAARQKGK
jgi:hypothetical protein